MIICCLFHVSCYWLCSRCLPLQLASMCVHRMETNKLLTYLCNRLAPYDLATPMMLQRPTVTPTVTPFVVQPFMA